jgi:hypothetical protein
MSGVAGEFSHRGDIIHLPDFDDEDSRSPPPPHKIQPPSPICLLRQWDLDFASSALDAYLISNPLPSAPPPRELSADAAKALDVASRVLLAAAEEEEYSDEPKAPVDPSRPFISLGTSPSRSSLLSVPRRITDFLKNLSGGEEGLFPRLDDAVMLVEPDVPPPPSQGERVQLLSQREQTPPVREESDESKSKSVLSAAFSEKMRQPQSNDLRDAVARFVRGFVEEPTPSRSAHLVHSFLEQVGGGGVDKNELLWAAWDPPLCSLFRKFCKFTAGRKAFCRLSGQMEEKLPSHPLWKTSSRVAPPLYFEFIIEEEIDAAIDGFEKAVTSKIYSKYNLFSL